MEVKIEDKDKAMLLVVLLPPSYKHFEEILLNSNSDILPFEYIKGNLLSKKKVLS